jgi:hypothetical protein
MTVTLATTCLMLHPTYVPGQFINIDLRIEFLSG